MKKFLTIALMVVSVGLVASSVEAKSSKSTAASNALHEPQIRVQVGGNNRRRNRRVYRTTRISPNGRRIVTRTYRTNGRRAVVTRRVVRRPYRRY